ncbi:MAG: hypothetical protein EOO20_21540 [Chryseobacterium sp.]|nr:MAG: hypothetical protein EOO20_21540 [Chryseobacterium sp.]
MKIIRIIVLLLIIVSCEKENEYFLNFDEVVHYKIEDSLINSIIHKEKKTEAESITEHFVFDWTDDGPITKKMITSLDHTLYTMYPLDTIHNWKLREIFKEDEIIFENNRTCEPVYRDMLVFKNKGKIIGLAKLCFDCEISDFMGTNADTKNFGGSQEFDRLRKIFEPGSRRDQ